MAVEKLYSTPLAQLPLVHLPLVNMSGVKLVVIVLNHRQQQNNNDHPPVMMISFGLVRLRYTVGVPSITRMNMLVGRMTKLFLLQFLPGIGRFNYIKE